MNGHKVLRASACDNKTSTQWVTAVYKTASKISASLIVVYLPAFMTTSGFMGQIDNVHVQLNEVMPSCGD